MKINWSFLTLGFLSSIVLILLIGTCMEKGSAGVAEIKKASDSAGLIESFSGSSIPQGYLLCDGSEVSRETYADLYKVIGTTYGSGDGSTTFNLPNYQGRIIVGKNTGTFNTLGGTGGSNETTLSVNNLPSHTHTATAKGTVASTFTESSATTNSSGAHTHTFSGTTSSNGNHSHTTYHKGYYNMNRVWEGSNYEIASYNEISSDPEYKFGYTNSAGAHTHTFSGTTNSAGTHTHTVTAKGSVASTFTGSSVTTSSTGNGSSFTNLQPYIVVNYIIKY